MSSRGLLAAKGHFGPILPRLLRARGSFCVHGRQPKRTLVASGDLASRGATAGNGVWQASIGGQREYSQLRSSRELALSKPFLLQRYQVDTLVTFFCCGLLDEIDFRDINGNMAEVGGWDGSLHSSHVSLRFKTLLSFSQYFMPQSHFHIIGPLPFTGRSNWWRWCTCKAV